MAVATHHQYIGLHCAGSSQHCLDGRALVPLQALQGGLGIMPGKRISEPLTGSLVGLGILVNRQNDHIVRHFHK